MADLIGPKAVRCWCQNKKYSKMRSSARKVTQTREGSARARAALPTPLEARLPADIPKTSSRRCKLHENMQSLVRMFVCAELIVSLILGVAASLAASITAGRECVLCSTSRNLRRRDGSANVCRRG